MSDRMPEIGFPSVPMVWRYPDDGQERAAPGETIFPIPLSQVDELRATITGPITVEDERGFVEVRQDGAPKDILVVLYGARLDRWHIAEGRLPDEPEDNLIYNIGLLYGTRLASNRYYQANDDRLVADSLDGYDAAVATVTESYTAIGGAEDWPSPWARERTREGGHTGTDLLSLMLTFAQDQVVEHYKQLYGGDAPKISNDRIQLALHMGMLDSVTFFDAYLHGKQGLPREYFREVKAFLSRDEESTAVAEGQRNHIDLTEFPEIAALAHDLQDRNETTFELPGGGRVRFGRVLVDTGSGELAAQPVIELLDGANWRDLARELGDDRDMLYLLRDPELEYDHAPGTEWVHKRLKAAMYSAAALGAGGGIWINSALAPEDAPASLVAGATAGGAILSCLVLLGAITYTGIKDHFYWRRTGMSGRY